ncbi:putative transposable element [Trichonephila clavipes]|nr:putative transposable element [Trichonephila clavipes]
MVNFDPQKRPLIDKDSDILALVKNHQHYLYGCLILHKKSKIPFWKGDFILERFYLHTYVTPYEERGKKNQREEEEEKEKRATREEKKIPPKPPQIEAANSFYCESLRSPRNTFQPKRIRKKQFVEWLYVHKKVVEPSMEYVYEVEVGSFVEGAQNEIAVVPDFHKRILFSDEAHFWLNGYVNKQNCRIWSEANPQVYVETPLHPEKLTVWCALWAGGIIGPYFFKNDEGHNVTVNGDRYRAMITNFFIPELNNHDVRSCGSNKTAQHVTQLVPQSIY